MKKLVIKPNVGYVVFQDARHYDNLSEPLVRFGNVLYVNLTREENVNFVKEGFKIVFDVSQAWYVCDAGVWYGFIKVEDILGVIE